MKARHAGPITPLPAFEVRPGTPFAAQDVAEICGAIAGIAIFLALGVVVWVLYFSTLWGPSAGSWFYLGAFATPFVVFVLRLANRLWHRRAIRKLVAAGLLGEPLSAFRIGWWFRGGGYLVILPEDLVIISHRHEPRVRRILLTRIDAVRRRPGRRQIALAIFFDDRAVTVEVNDSLELWPDRELWRSLLPSYACAKALGLLRLQGIPSEIGG